jgi:acyl-CoA synthetase (AMP-forming)/AMP-acid ligase II
MHPDGYIELRDRKKDVIISGGENISTIEVEFGPALRHDADKVASASSVQLVDAAAKRASAAGGGCGS